MNLADQLEELDRGLSKVRTGLRDLPGLYVSKTAIDMYALPFPGGFDYVIPWSTYEELCPESRGTVDMWRAWTKCKNGY